jgi:hypothetical protein
MEDMRPYDLPDEDHDPRSMIGHLGQKGRYRSTHFGWGEFGSLEITVVR